MKRKIKIEERGEFYAKKTFPTIRLKGKWLERAGFLPGAHVTFTLLSPGLAQLSASESEVCP